MVPQPKPETAAPRTFGHVLHATGLFAAGLLAALLLLASCSSKPIDGPSSALQPFKRGVMAYQDEDFPRAAKLFEQAVAMDDRSPNIYFNLGLTYYQLEAYPEAIEAYTKALRLDPKFADAHMNLALAYDKTYDLEQANSHYNEYLAIIRAQRIARGEPAPGKGDGMAATAKPPKPQLPGQALNTLPGIAQASSGRQAGEMGMQSAQGSQSGQMGQGSSMGQSSSMGQASQSNRSGAPIPRPRSGVPANGPKASLNELRRMPPEAGKSPRGTLSNDSNSSQANQWWTQDAPPKSR